MTTNENLPPNPRELRQIHIDNGACSMSIPDRMCISCREVVEADEILNREETESDRATFYDLDR